jgi:hypothetical protein
MNDEEFGRLWATQNNQPPPNKVSSHRYLWYSAEDNGYPHLHVSLTVLLDREFYVSESHAYADLGRAVREIRREVPDLKTT